MASTMTRIWRRNRLPRHVDASVVAGVLAACAPRVVVTSVLTGPAGPEAAAPSRLAERRPFPLTSCCRRAVMHIPPHLLADDPRDTFLSGAAGRQPLRGGGGTRFNRRTP